MGLMEQLLLFFGVDEKPAENEEEPLFIGAATEVPPLESK